MKAKETLETALELVTGDRAEQHGDMEAVHKMTADLWQAFTGHPFDAQGVALMLALLKLARETCAPGNPDNLIDMAGYAAIAAELSDAPYLKGIPNLDTVDISVETGPAISPNGHVHETHP